MKLTEQKLKELILEMFMPYDTDYLIDSFSGTLKFWTGQKRGPLRPGSHRHGAATEEIIEVFDEAWNSRNPIVSDETAPGGKRFEKDLEMTALHEQLRDFCLFIINDYDHSDEYQRKLKKLALQKEGLVQAAELASALGLI